MAPVIEWRTTGIALTGFESGPQNNPEDALGKWISTTDYSGDVLNNFFRAFTLAEMQGPSTFYFGSGFINTSVDALQDARIYVDSFSLPAGVTISLGVDNTAGMDVRANAMIEVADNTTAPAGISFTNISSLTDYSNGLNLGVGAADQDLTDLVQAQVWHRIELSSASSFTPGFDFVDLALEGSP